MILILTMTTPKTKKELNSSFFVYTQMLVLPATAILKRSALYSTAREPLKTLQANSEVAKEIWHYYDPTEQHLAD